MWQILMLTVEPRTDQFVRIATKLSDQCAAFNGEVEILVDRDNFDRSMFHKRNRLVQYATAEYICFVDDDDDVSDRYVEAIMEQLRKGPDCVGFRLQMNADLPVWLSKDNASDYIDGDWHYYPISHLNPFRTSLARTGPYGPTTDGWTDHDGRVANELRQIAQTEECVARGETMYFYTRSGGSLSNQGRPTPSPTVTPNPVIPFVGYL